MKRSALFFLLAAAASLRADLTLVQRVDMAGTPGEMTIKFKGDKVRVDPAPQVSMISDAKTGDTITLIHGEKKVMRISGDKMKAAQPSAFANSGTNIPDFRDLPGVPVKIEMDTARGHVIITLISAKRDPIPNSVFDVPANYTDMKMPDLFGGKKVPENPADSRVPGSPPRVPAPSVTP